LTERKDQPAQLKRRIAQLEGQLAAEQERSEKAWSGYRAALYEMVEIKLRLEAVVRAVNGEAV
jgi:hypothetical protein